MREHTRNTACPCMFLHVPKKNSDSIEMNLKKSRNWLWVSPNKQAVIFLGPFPFTNVHASWKPSGKRWARLSCPANSLTFQPVKIPAFLTSKNVESFRNERVELGTSALDTHSNFLSINFWGWFKKKNGDFFRWWFFGCSPTKHHLKKVFNNLHTFSVHVSFDHN